VAIKQLLIKNQQNIDEFLNEVVIITGVKHRNLVKLKGCCLRDNKRLLVYEYLENGDLAKVLFGKFVNINKYFNTFICFYMFFLSCIL
jgi:serine/threonine protein kinase